MKIISLNVGRPRLVMRNDEVELIEKNTSGVRVVDVTRLYSSDKHNVDLLQRAIATEALPSSWRDYFKERLDTLN